MAIIKKEDFKCPGFKMFGILVFWRCKWIYRGAICMHPNFIGKDIPFCPTHGNKPKKSKSGNNG
jgi:hypothetical protein